MRYRVAVQGFSAFERATFESFFRLTARRAPAYDHVGRLRDCDYAIVDADLPAAMDAARAAGKLERALLIGSAAPGTGAACLPRPINLMHLLRVLDELTSEEAPVRSPVPPPPARPGPAEAAASATTAARVPAAAVVAPIPGFTTRRLLPDDPAASGRKLPRSVLTEGDEKFDHILVVDDSDIALRFMQSRLRRFGFQVHLAKSGEEALRMLDERMFQFVFLDVMMQGMDGYQTCKSIKRRSYAPEGRPPVVVMLTSRAGAIDKIRGTLAGCDAYLTKPLLEDELVRVIGEHDEAFQRSFDTTVGGVASARPSGA
ncbi:MAG TPA: response regulator [Burkholderiaceae bacterium]|nr:response regulator [Burkholderiaceae bacterium]